MNPMPKLLLFSLLVLSTTAHAISIDGDLKDWIGKPVGSQNDWKPIDPSVRYFVDDQSNNSLSYRGGQGYDAEAIYIKRDALNFYVAVVTGLAPSNTSYPAGDLAFDFGNDGSYEYGVVVKSDSSNSNGGIGKNGQVYDVTEWNLGLWDDDGVNVGIGHGTQEHPTTVKSGTSLGFASLVYQLAEYKDDTIDKLGRYSGNHYLIEARISNSFFDNADLDKSFSVHWTMACANDPISIDSPSNVPTPDILPLLGLGLMMLIGFRRHLNQNASGVCF
jgi:hypothetical protein